MRNQFQKNSIKLKLLLILATGVIFSGISTFLIAQFVVLGRFEEIEKKNIIDHMGRVSDAVQMQVDALDNKFIDWSMWDDAYSYMQNKNKNFESSTLALNAMLAMDIDLFLFIHQNGDVQWARKFNVQRDNEAPVEEDLISILKTSALSFFETKNFERKSGLINLPSLGPTFVTYLKIVKSNGEGPAVGTLIAARVLNNKIMNKLSSLTKLNLSLVELNQGLHGNKSEVSNMIPNAEKKTEQASPHSFVINEDSVSVFVSLFDFTGHPLGQIHFIKNRETYKSGVSALVLFLLGLILIGIFWGIASWNLLRVYIVDRLLSLTQQMNKLKSSVSHTGRVSISGDDEIADLSRATNQFLHELEDMHKKLETERIKTIHTAKLASLGEMSAGVAHEINNPLMALTAGLYMLEQNHDNPEEFRKRINVLSMAVDRIERIVSGLKKFSRTHQDGEKKQEVLLHVIESALIFTEVKTKKFEVEMRIKCSEKIHLLINSADLEQVIINLVSNAVDAIKDISPRWIEISAFEAPHEIVLRIIDSGQGIPDSIRERLFEPFYTTKPIGEGTGLGLAIVKGIIEQNNGKIDVLKEHLNTCFEIRFDKGGMNR